jgi:hypothetical protein
VLDTGNNRLVEFDRADPPSLTFASTNVGTTSADSPQTVTLVNSGNLNLIFPIPTLGNNPTISSNFTLDSGGASDCPFLASDATSPGNLAPGATCLLPLSFTPLSGGLSTGSLALTDNNLNSGSNFKTQAIALTGFGDSFALSASPLALSITQGKSGTTTVTVTNIGWTEKVKLAILHLPSGASAQFSPDQATSTSSLTLSVGGNTPTGTYTLPVTGTSGGLTESTTVLLTVVPRKG